jgi:hypothetical protein
VGVENAGMEPESTEVEEPEEQGVPEVKSNAIEDERSFERERDAIEKGIVSEEEAMELHQMCVFDLYYFTGSVILNLSQVILRDVIEFW